MLQNHEKFWAFCLLGLGVMVLAMAAYIWPPAEGTGTQRIIDAAMGGLLLALGGATQALFRIRDAGEDTVTIDNKPGNPVPTTDAPETGELPENQKL